MLKENKKGFTIIELLVVIAIIGLLATISMVALNGARKKSRDAKRLADIKQYQTALEMYFNDNNKYPITNHAGLDLGSKYTYCIANTSTGFGKKDGSIDECSTATKVYMVGTPANPTPGGRTYYYEKTNNGASYKIYFSLEEATGGYAAGEHIATPDGIR